MLMNGDLEKIQKSINSVLVPMGERLAALEAKVEALEAPKAAPKPAKADPKT